MSAKMEKEYKKLHENRLHLLFAGMLSDKENENIKKKIESWGRKNKVTVASDYLKTLDKINQSKSSSLTT